MALKSSGMIILYIYIAKISYQEDNWIRYCQGGTKIYTRTHPHTKWPVHRCGTAVACAPVTQRARVRSPVGTSFLGEIFSSPVTQMSGSFRPPKFPNINWPSLSSSIIIHYGRQWPEMLTRPKTWNIHTYIVASFFIHCYLETLQHLGHIASRVFGCIPEDCVFLLLCSQCLVC